MTVRDLVGFSLRTLRGHRLRSGLSVAGVAIGIASVMLLTSLGEGARLYVTGEFASLGSNLVIIVPGRTETEGEAPLFSEAPNDLTLDDMEAVLRRCRRVVRAAPISLGSAMAQAGSYQREVTISGTTAEMRRIRGIKMRVGRFLPEGEAERSARVCVIGSKLHRELFPDMENPVGEALRLGTERYKVIGVMEPRGLTLGMDLDEFVEIPVAAALSMFDQRGLFRIMCEIRSNEETHQAAEEIRAILKERHDGVDDITIILQDSVIASLTKILNVLTAALAAIAAISLAVAGIGIMNVMLVSVSERTSEIGLMKALGAENLQVLELFLVEASLLSGLGGVLGIAGGYGFAALVRWTWPAFPAEPPQWAVVAGVIVALAVGLGFGAIPARRAARLEPVAALAKRGK